jgi:hypothetical protein
MSGASLGRIEIEIDGDGPRSCSCMGWGDIELIPTAPASAPRLSLHPA